MNPIDTVAAALGNDQVAPFLGRLTQYLHMIMNPPCVGLIVNLCIVQGLEAFDHLLPVKLLVPGTKDISKAMAITLSIILSMPVFSFLCYMARWEVRGENFLFGFVGGIGGVFISAILDRLGFNLDRIWGQHSPDAPAV